MSPSGGGSAGSAARRVALRTLVAVESGDRSDRALDRELSRARLTERDRRLATEIVYGTLRRRGSLDRTLAPFSRRPWSRLDPTVRNALRMGAYQAALLRSVPSHAAVDATVAAVPGHRRGARGLVNAVLRAWLRSGGQLDAGEDLAGRLEVPEWLAHRWLERYGEQIASAWFEATLHPPIPVVRVHPRVLTPTGAIERLASEGIDAVISPWIEQALRIRQGNVVATETFRSGALSARGEAGQLVARLLPPAAGGLVLDACAGRGGKAVQLAEECGARRVVAIDLTHRRLRDAAAAARDAATPEVVAVAGDLAQPAPLRARFERILVDAPCSGLGTIRRHPEIKWRLGQERLSELATLQRRILTTALDLLAPGGTLLYVTCSTEPEENEQVVSSVLAERQDVAQVAIAAVGAPAPCVGPDGAFRTFPQQPDLDGLYAAMLQRSPGGR